MDIAFGGYTLRNIGIINVILGKNGCGKSTLLRSLEQARRNIAHVRYITPERGGILTRDGGVETNMQNTDWLSNVRGKNRYEQFRQVSAAEFRKLETLVLRKIERDPALRQDTAYTFDNTVRELNELLDNVEVVRSADGGFQIRNKGAQDWRSPDTLSSGESELVSLGIEILSFSYSSEDARYTTTDNWLLFDEPDAHLHPDLQHKLMRLLVRAAENKPFKVLISTHSTAIVSALSEFSSVHLAFMGRDQRDLPFEDVGDALKAVMPIFGAHPLSNVFNARPILLVEGEDDERIWQQAARSSCGKVNVWPCAAGDIQSLAEYEEKARAILSSVYDNASAYSLRDRDAGPYEIDDLRPVIRARLNCRSAENLIVTDEVLAVLGSDWGTVQLRLENWIGQNSRHPQHPDAVRFRDSDWDRANADLKPLRNLLVALAGSQKPWEVAVGQAIAGLQQSGGIKGGNLREFLGVKIVDALNLRSTSAPTDRTEGSLITV